MIIYYSGHADPDEKRGKAVWTAFSSATLGDPRLDWFEIQPTLFCCNCDVLLILDCCYASLATKGPQQGRLEILAATADSSRTPRPGVNSFTNFLVQQLRQVAEEGRGIKVNELHTRINQSALQNPILFNMRPDPKSSILLVPMPTAAKQLGIKTPDAIEQSALASLTFTVGVSQPLSLNIIRELGAWLKANAPNVISEVKVDKLVDLTRGLHEFVMCENSGGVQGRLIDNCGEMDRGLIISKLQDLTIQADRACATIASMSLTRERDIEQFHSRLKHDFQELCGGVNAMSRTLLSLLADHTKFQSQGALKDLLVKSATGQAGFFWPIKLSLVSLGESVLSPAQKLPAGAVKLDRCPCPDDIYVTGIFNNKRVLVELVPTNEPESDLDRTSVLLSQPIPETLRIPHCVGVTVDPTTRRPGLVFDFNAKFEHAPTLTMLFEDENSTPPLEDRFNIAYEVTASLQALHNVRWVHKGVRCCNVVILRDQDTTYEPWLFGFRKSRETVDESKRWPEYRTDELIYLPNSRWSSPSEQFTYQHDIYALGVVLLEIGLWASLPKLRKSLRKRGTPFQEVFDTMVELCHEYLRQIMGSSYASIVQKCLSQWGQGGSVMTHSDFDREIVSVLEELAQNLGA